LKGERDLLLPSFAVKLFPKTTRVDDARVRLLCVVLEMKPDFHFHNTVKFQYQKRVSNDSLIKKIPLQWISWIVCPISSWTWTWNSVDSPLDFLIKLFGLDLLSIFNVSDSVLSDYLNNTLLYLSFQDQKSLSSSVVRDRKCI
jgi:hypothetical protein